MDSSHLKLILLKPHLIVRRKNTVLKILRCICWANKPWPFVSKSRSYKYIKTRTLYNSRKEMHFPCTKFQIYSLNDVSNGLPLQWILYQVGKCQVVYFDSSATQSQGTVWLLFPRTNKNKSIESQNNSKLSGPTYTSEETELSVCSSTVLPTGSWLIRLDRTTRSQKFLRSTLIVPN